MAPVKRIQEVTNIGILKMAIFKKMSASTLLKIRQMNRETCNFIDSYMNVFNPQLDLQQLTIFKNMLFLAPRGTIKYVRRGNGQPFATFSLVQDNIKQLKTVEELLEIPNLVLHGVAAINAEQHFVDSLVEILEKMNISESVRLSLYGCTMRIGSSLLRTLRPKELLIDAHCEEHPPIFVNHPAFQSVESLSYAPSIEMIRISERFQNVEIRCCDDVDSSSIRDDIKKWIGTNNTWHFRRFWGCYFPIEDDVENIFKDMKEESLWSREEHQSSFLKDIDIKTLSQLNNVFTVKSSVNEDELLLAVATQHRLLIQTMNQKSLNDVLKVIQKNPTLLDEGVILPGDK